ncbi:MAG TPA: DNA methyltransferase [Planctomycetaceae bacterium]|nr:DNA methyltransferase [Planctomycetaceae bacterium]
MRSGIRPILERIPAARQRDTRHYGVHPYFTRRPPNVVRRYIETYTEPGDVVLDPFGGTGVTAIEACLLGRTAIQNDLNPFANFLARCLIESDLATTYPLREAFGRVEDACRRAVQEIERSEESAGEWLTRVSLPENIRLPRTSDAEHFFDLFTPRQLAGLAVIKQAIDAEADASVRDPLLLAWSAAVAKLNRTFLSAKGRAASRGGSSIFSIYRYKLASDVVELPIWETFEGRFRNVLKALGEILQSRRLAARPEPQTAGRFRVLAHDAARLDSVLEPGSVDYIFTDPPYGGFISYLDLSVMWNHWLGFPVCEAERDSETIVGGEQRLTEDHYKRSLADSLQVCLRLLKPDRWMSVVFQHWDVSYFETILRTVTDSGAELRAAITQTEDVIWSMHKKKNSTSVLGGEMILTFYKPERVRAVAAGDGRQPEFNDAPRVLEQAVDECLSGAAGEFTHEALFNRMLMELWKRNALSCLRLGRAEFAGQLESRGWTYDAARHRWVNAAALTSPSTAGALF